MLANNSFIDMINGDYHRRQSQKQQHQQQQQNYSRRRCSFVPWLVGQFNDIIEWNAQIVQSDIDSQAQRVKNSNSYQRRYSIKNDYSCSFAGGLQRSATDSSISRRFQFTPKSSLPSTKLISNDSSVEKLEKQQHQQNSTESCKPARKKRIIKLRSQPNQDYLNEKLNQLRRESSQKIIIESNDENEIVKDDPITENNNDNQIKIELTTMQIDLIDFNEYNYIVNNDNDNKLKNNENSSDYQSDNTILEIKINDKRNEFNEKHKNDDRSMIFSDKIDEEFDIEIKNDDNYVEKDEETKKDEHIADFTDEIAETIEKINKNLNHDDNIFDKIEIDNSEESTGISVDENNNMIEMKNEIIDEQPVYIPKPKPKMNNYNSLLEKLSNQYRHHFQMKTVVQQQNSASNFMMKNKQQPTSINRNCFCGKEFNFSEKYLQCFTCLTSCHVNCGQLVPRPCIRYVDPFIRLNKLITNFIFPRSKPLIPSILVQLCKKIEQECQINDDLNINDAKQMNKLLSTNFELYYVKNEMLKQVKDQLKRLLQNAKNGLHQFNDYNLNHICGMIKYFLGDMIEQVFSKQLWKDYSTIIHKKSDDELRMKLLESFKELSKSSTIDQANLNCLIFVLIHLKHLIRYHYQNNDIVADIFCPILLGDIECKRKLRLMKLLLDIDDNLLISFFQF